MPKNGQEVYLDLRFWGRGSIPVWYQHRLCFWNLLPDALTHSRKGSARLWKDWACSVTRVSRSNSARLGPHDPPYPTVPTPQHCDGGDKPPREFQWGIQIFRLQQVASQRPPTLQPPIRQHFVPWIQQPKRTGLPQRLPDRVSSHSSQGRFFLQPSFPWCLLSAHCGPTLWDMGASHTRKQELALTRPTVL